MKNEDAAPRRCEGGGALVSDDNWLPTEPFDYDWVFVGPAIGCNHLACGECGVEVRSLLGFDLPPDIEAAEVYELIGKNDRSRFVESVKSRIYACRHHAIVATGREFLANPPQYGEGLVNFDYPPSTPWECGCHPALSLPAVLEGVAVDEKTDWGQLARQSFAGKLGVSLHPSIDRFGWFWLQRLYRLLGDLPSAAKIASAAADQLTDPDPRVRLNAIEFFLRESNAPGAERLASALRDHPELFVDVRVDEDPTTLERYLLQAILPEIANRLGDTVAIELMRAALSRRFEWSLEPWLVGIAARVDQKWLLEHGDEVVAVVPELWKDMQAALESAGASKSQIAKLTDRVRARRAGK